MFFFEDSCIRRGAGTTRLSARLFREVDFQEFLKIINKFDFYGNGTVGVDPDFGAFLTSFFEIFCIAILGTILRDRKHRV